MGKIFRSRIWTGTGGSIWKQNDNMAIICQVNGKEAKPVTEIN